MESVCVCARASKMLAYCGSFLVAYPLCIWYTVSVVNVLIWSYLVAYPLCVWHTVNLVNVLIWVPIWPAHVKEEKGRRKKALERCVIALWTYAWIKKASGSAKVFNLYSFFGQKLFAHFQTLCYKCVHNALLLLPPGFHLLFTDGNGWTRSDTVRNGTIVH